MTSARMLRRCLSACTVGLLLLSVSGCFNPFAPRIAPTTSVYVPPPEPNSPQNVIRLFEWCWKNRDITVYNQIFTDDFRFIFALGDSAGNLVREDPVTRETELTMARNLFVGGGSAPPASSISLILDPTLRALPDSRVGKNPKWHNEIVTSVDLTIKTEEGAEYRIVGDARFFVVRGDSALIPQVLGFGRDSTRWYIERWHDETLKESASTAPDPAGAGSLQAARPFGRVTVSTVERLTSRPGAPAALTTRPFEMTWGELTALYSY
jgi:hypothetical protein